MMVIVPSVAERKQGYKQVVPARVSAVEAAASQKMTDRVGAVDGMMDQDRADKETPGQHL